MSFVSVAPDVVTTASGNLANIGAAVRAANAAAAAQTTAIAAPAADEVSAAVTSFFGTAAQEYQSLSTAAAAFHEKFVGTLNAAAGQYVSAEAANVQQTLLNAVNAPAQALLGHPLIGTGQATSAAGQTINTPFGPISISSGGSLPHPGQNGPFSAFASATTPLGGAMFSLHGNVLTGPSGPGTEFQVTGGTLNWPWLVSLFGAGAGPTITGGASLMNSANTFLADLSHGNFLGAAGAFVSAPFNYTNAVLFGHDVVTIPIGATGYGGPPIELRVPFGGLFASPEPIRASWPTFNTSSGGATVTVLGENIAFGGSQLSGFFPFLLGAIGL